MNEIENGRVLTIDDYLAIVRRRLWWIVVPVILGPIIAYGVSLRLPSRYTSRTLVLVEGQKVPDSFVKPVVTEVLDDRLATMKEQILSRTRLEPIIGRFGLFSDEERLSMESKLELMRKATQVTPVRGDYGVGKAGLKGFEVSFTASQPRLAQDVCRELTSMFMQENLKAREQRSQGTTEFLLSQLNVAKQKLDQEDAKLADFKRKYIGQLPGEDQANFNMLASLNTQLEASTQAISQLQQTKSYTEALLNAQLQSWTTMNRGSGNSVPPETLDNQLARSQAQLTELASKYTDTHPDVIRLKRDIEQLRRKIQEQAAQPRETVAQETGPEPPQIQQLRAQLSSTQLAISDKQRNQARIQQQIQAYQARIQLSPVVEAQYKALTREHESALAFYNELLGKRNQSEMATDLERRQEGEQFRVLDAPNLPEKPTFPNRPLFAAGGFGGGLALGVGMVVIFEFLKKSFRNEKDVLFYLQLPTLTVVPDLEKDSSREKDESSALGKGSNSLVGRA